jgi:hypothetical protein
MMRKVHKRMYDVCLRSARNTSELVAGATSKPEEMPADGTYYVSDDLMSGFGVQTDGTLIGVYNLIKGRGVDMVWEAVLHYGADRLDCFDGFLPVYYKQFGFVEYERAPNWTPGGPDVVFMQLRV